MFRNALKAEREFFWSSIFLDDSLSKREDVFSSFFAVFDFSNWPRSFSWSMFTAPNTRNA